MKCSKRILCLLLAGCMLLLAACRAENREDNDRTGVGRYVESVISPPIDGQFSCFLTNDSTIVCFDEGLKTRYESADGGENWSEAPGPGRDTDRYRYITASTLLPDGGLLLYLPDEGLISLSSDGGGAPYPMIEIDQAIENGESVMISLLQALDENRLLIGFIIGGGMVRIEPSGDGSDTSGDGPSAPEDGPRRASGSISDSTVRKTVLYDLTTGQKVAELPTEDATAAISGDGYLYLMDSAGGVTAYHLSDGTSADSPKVDFGGGRNAADQRGMGAALLPSMGGNILAMGADGGLYAVYEKNLLFADLGGNMNTVLESTAYSIGAPRGYVSNVYIIKDGGIVINLLDGQKNSLYKYIWDENAVIDVNKTITVWSLEDNAFVRAAIAELRKKNPDASFTYEVALEGGSAVSASDAIKTLNTRLLNNSGPDVILLDGCPVESYADQGMLLDLSDVLDTGDVFENLLAPYIKGGKLYYLPTQFFMPALMGSADALSKARTLDDLVRLIVDGNGPSMASPNPGGGSGGGPFGGVPEGERAELYFDDLKELCDILWLASAPAVISANRLELDALRRYLEAVKAISDKYALTDTQDRQGGMGMSVGFSDGGTATVLPSSLVRYTAQMTNYGAFSAGNLQLLQLMMDRDGAELTLFPGLTPGAWQPSAVVGISADAKARDFAVELVKIMLSLEVQRLNYGAGLPVTRAGIAAQVVDVNNRLAENNRGSFDLDVGSLVETLQTPSTGDASLSDMMWDSIEALCRGEIDIEAAVRGIDQSVKNYLAERS